MKYAAHTPHVAQANAPAAANAAPRCRKCLRPILAILLVLLPFGMWAQERAVIPDNSVTLADFGAVPDGVTLNTEAFKKAIASLSKQGGGHLNVPEGLWLTGPIVLKDAIDLHLERGAVILLSPDKKDSYDGKSVKNGISASKRHDVSITGEGIIDGNGAMWRPVKRSKVSDVEWKDYRRMGGTVTDDGSLWYPFALKHFEDIADNPRSQEKMRVHLVRFNECKRVTVEGVTIQNAPKFHLVPARCEDVVIEGVTVRCPWNAQNGDGIDIMHCQKVRIAHCSVDVGDDGICLKAGAGEKGVQGGPCKDIVIEHNTVFHAHGGFVIGSEFSGGMENIIVRHNIFCGTDTGLRFKSAPERGGKTSNIRISDIVMTDIRGEAIVFQTTYADRPAGYEDNEAATTQAYLPEFTDIAIERLVCRGCSAAIRSKGSIKMIHDISLKDVTIFYNETERDIDDPLSIKMENVRLLTF